MPNVTLAGKPENRSSVVVLDGNTAVVKLKWFCFRQNNSGGHFVVDDVQAHDVYVQAATADEAWNRIKDQLDYSYCHCCGERWSNWLDDDDGCDVPTKYDEVMWNRKPDNWFNDEARLHFYDGRVTAYFYDGTVPQEFAGLVALTHE